MAEITKHLEIAVSDADAGRITYRQLLRLFQEAIDNGDILFPDNEFVVVATIIPLLDQGVLRRSQHVSLFEQRMDSRLKAKLKELRHRKETGGPPL